MENKLILNKIDLLPLKAVLIYVSVGVLLSFFGPITYTNYEILPVASYIYFFLIIFTIGYISGLINFNKTKEIKNISNTHKIQIKIYRWVKISIIIMSIVQFTTLSISLFNDDLNLFITDIGKAYVSVYSNYERGTGNVSITFLVQIFTYIPYLVSLILGAYYFKELPKSYKLMIIFIYLSIVLMETIGHGKQKQLGDLFIFISIVSLLKVDLRNTEFRRKLFKRLFMLSILMISSLVGILYSRYSAIGVNPDNINKVSHPLMQYNTEHFIFKIFGDEIGFSLSVLTSYLSQGYYGLSLSMQEPFQWTYFIGNSYSLTVFMQRFLGVPVDFHDTYPYRAALNSGWDDAKWSTVFSWFAGDFTFLGTLFLFALVAFLYAKVWKEAYYYKNPIAIVIFSMLTIALLYIPSNNQLMHTPGSIIAIVFFISLWILKHRKYNFLQTNSLKDK